MLGRLADISQSGMKIVAPERLSEDTALRCRLVFPEPIGNMAEIELDAIHVWSRENDQAGWHEVGYVFNNPSPTVIEALKTLTEKLLLEETARVTKILESKK
jgi:hypothetical protein